MQLYCVYVTLCALSCMQFHSVSSYPTLGKPRWYGSTADVRFKKSDPAISQSDADVLALEHLKEKPAEEPIVIEVANSDSDLLPELELELERQLETVTPAVEAAPESNAKQETGQGAHRPPTLPHNDGGKMAGSGSQQHSTAEAEAAAAATSAAVPSMIKPFYGAARLAFGQNPEVLPTPSTSSTSSTTSTTTTTTAVPALEGGDEKQTVVLANDESNGNAAATELKSTAESSGASPFDNEGQTTHYNQATNMKELESENEGELESERDVVDVEVNVTTQKKEPVGEVLGGGDNLHTPKTAARRSLALMPPKTMAQYVFWTGDEAGVARAIEEFIEQGLMTREGALKFLRDIRLSMEHLQRQYKNRLSTEEEPHQNNLKKSYGPMKLFAPYATTTATSTSTTPSTTSTTTEAPLPLPLQVNENADEFVDQQQQFDEDLGKTLNRISNKVAWTKLQPLNIGEPSVSNAPNVDVMGRAKLAEFLYTEHTLEEILYKLAKVMFTQSLAQGSDEAQRELQKLTNFLEREGNLGVIPIDLQRSVLNVLLTALSDTLTEHPELLPAANANLVHLNKRYSKQLYAPANLKI